jgi:hypothetical protein
MLQGMTVIKTIGLVKSNEKSSSFWGTFFDFAELKGQAMMCKKGLPLKNWRGGPGYLRV